MKRYLVIIIVLIAARPCLGQVQIADDHRHINLGAYLIGLEQVMGKDSIVHADSAYGFQVTIPQWWHIKETPLDFFGGTFPAVDSIENALIFKCFEKTKFNNLGDFENWVIKDYSMGQKPKWSQEHTILLKKELDDFKQMGNAYKVQILRGNKIYHCCYIITQTDKAYVWIDFTATETTYPKNFERFKEVVSLFKGI